jgi:hypothetical protein
MRNMPWSSEFQVPGRIFGNATPSAIMQPDERLIDIFFVGDDLHLRRTEGIGTHWLPENRIIDSGKVINSGTDDTPYVAPVRDGNIIYLFYMGSDNRLWQIKYIDDNTWIGPDQIQGGRYYLASKPTGLKRGPSTTGVGEIDLFYRGRDNNIKFVWLDMPGTWSDEQTIGGTAQSAPSAASWGPDRMDVGYRGGNNSFGTITATGPRNFGGQQDWETPPLIYGPALAAARLNVLHALLPGNGIIRYRLLREPNWENPGDAFVSTSSQPSMVATINDIAWVFYSRQNQIFSLNFWRSNVNIVIRTPAGL